MNSRWRNLILSILAAGMMVLPAVASAKARILLINTGTELFEVADFPDAVRTAWPKTAELKLGTLCHHFGVFWADVWTWDCKLVAVDPELDAYMDLPPEIASQVQDHSPADAKRGFYNKYAFWVLICGALAVFAALAFAGRNDPEPDSRLAA